MVHINQPWLFTIIISTELRGSYCRDFILENINRRRADCHGSRWTALFCIHCLSFLFFQFLGGVGQALVHCSDPLSANTPKRVSRNLTPCQLIFTLVVVIRFSTYECLRHLTLFSCLCSELIQCLGWT